MNKLFTLFLFLLIPHICFGEQLRWVDENGNEVSDQEVSDFISNSFQDGIRAMAEEMQPVYKNMENCLPVKNQYFEILGMEKNLCHFKYMGYDCFVPLNIAQEYASLSLKNIQQTLKGNFSTQSPESVRTQEILSDEKYCSYEMLGNVMSEKRNAEEFSADLIVGE